MFYNARYYSPYLNRWLQPDVIVPDGEKASIIPLTVSYHELPLLAQLNAENAFTLQHGHWPQLSAAEKREAKINRGPLNPQQLNRYSYVLNNPLKFTDPDGHDTWCNNTFTSCTGGVVHNNSSSDILVRGDLMTSDGILLQGYIFTLRAGQSSSDIGLVDVDQIIVNRGFLEVNDGASVGIIDNDRTGRLQVVVEGDDTVNVGGVELYSPVGGWGTYSDDYDLTPRSTNGHFDTSDISFARGAGGVAWARNWAQQFPCPDRCISLTPLYIPVKVWDRE